MYYCVLESQEDKTKPYQRTRPEEEAPVAPEYHALLSDAISYACNLWGVLQADIQIFFQGQGTPELMMLVGPRTHWNILLLGQEPIPAEARPNDTAKSLLDALHIAFDRECLAALGTDGRYHRIDPNERLPYQDGSLAIFGRVHQP